MKDKTSHRIRNANFADALEIFNMIKSHPDELVPRSISDIIQNVDRFIVCEKDGRVVGTASWGILPEIGVVKNPTIEIKSVAVDASARGLGIGLALVKKAIARVRPLHPEQLIVLTFVPEFFRKFGFTEVPKETIMHKLYTGCVNCSKYDSPFTCPEVAMVMKPSYARPAASAEAAAT